jgi:predicted nucleotidyltransferase
MRKSVTSSVGVPVTLESMRPIVRRITRAYGVQNVRVFGSFVRGEQRKQSDLDLLVDLPDDMSLLDLSGLKIALEEALHRRVDVVPSGAIKPALRERILAEARTL